MLIESSWSNQVEKFELVKLQDKANQSKVEQIKIIIIIIKLQQSRLLLFTTVK